MSAQSHNHGHFSTVAAPTRCDGSGNPCHIHTDRQGNVRAVVRDGNLVEANDYYPYGMLMADADGKIPDKQPYKLSGKEYITTRGLNLYDFGARMHDPAAMRFSTPDPLMEQYPSLSPYTYCAANPLKYIDPSGMKIRIDAPEYQKYIEQILNHLRNDNFFGPVMTYIDGHTSTYTISMMGPTINPDGERSFALTNLSSQAIYIDRTQFYSKTSPGFKYTPFNPSLYFSCAEELYHIFQELTPICLGSNPEFEAKVAAFLGTYTKIGGVNYNEALNDFVNYIYSTIAKDDILKISFFDELSFEIEYIHNGTKFSGSYKNSKLPNYSDPVLYMPNRLRYLIQETREQKECLKTFY